MSTVLDLSSATALVTGASGGIGEQFARQLAARGASLVLTARSTDKLQGLASELRQAHPRAAITVLTADLSDPGAPAKLAADLTAAGTTVDLLVNNAGIGSYGLFAGEDTDAVVGQVQLNCVSVAALTSLLLPGMLTRGRGGVINVSSTSAFQPIPTMAVYGASKAFVLSFTEAVWVETRGTGVHVLALCPGPTSTPFFDTASPDQAFLTRGRQSPHQVVALALRTFQSGRGPTVISGNANRLSSMGYRVLPRAIMARMAGNRMSRSS